MKTKTIFKALALAMLMPATMLTTACSSEDNLAANNNENTEVVNEKGYPLQVTVNVTREGDATTRATYNESTKKLEFSTGDQLFVKGWASGTAGGFAGTLEWQSGSTFSGTIYTYNTYDGTFDELFTVGDAQATLLPAGYGTYNYLSIDGSGTYSAQRYYDRTKAFTTSKATAVEQFSFEYGSYSSGIGFTLSPQHAILNFTITGLTPNATGVAVSFTNDWCTITGSVDANSSGHATFLIGEDGVNLKDHSITVGGNVISLGISSDKNTEGGKIYNILKKVPGSGLSLVDAFTEGNTTAIVFGDNLTLTSTYSAGSFGEVTPTGNMYYAITSASMARSGNNLVISVTVNVGGMLREGSMTIDIGNNTYSWSNAVVGSMITLSDITINGTSIEHVLTAE